MLGRSGELKRMSVLVQDAESGAWGVTQYLIGNEYLDINLCGSRRKERARFEGLSIWTLDGRRERSCQRFGVRVALRDSDTF